MSLQKIRYKIANDVEWFNLMDDQGNPTCVQFDHFHTYFVDILDASDHHRAKIRIYMPDGNDLVGWQSLDWITLHFLEDPFKGQFNRIGRE